MAIIYSYPETLELLPADMLIGTSTIRVAGKKKNITKNFTLELLKNFILDGVTNVQWGTITGTLSNQTDLQAALNAKQNNITLTTTGSSGPATLVGATLNVPDYSTGITVPTLDQVLTAGNTSILAAKIGVLYGYDNVNSDYGTLEFYDSGIVIKAATTNHFLFYNDDSGTVQFSNGAYKPTLNFAGVGNNIYTFQNANGTLAFTSDIPSLAGYVPDTRTISTITPLQGGGDLSANRTLSILQSSSLQDGYLSSTDWTMFNNKQSAITLTTTGSGAATLIANVLNIPTPAAATFSSLTTIGSSGSSTLVSGTLNVPTYTLSGLGGQPLATNLTSLSGLTYASTSFVKMTAAGTFALDTNTYLTSAVTSIGMTVPSAFNVTPSTITSSGTFAITGAGAASQYVRGDGTLANFPTSTGGGASVSYYLNGSVSQGTIGGVAYKEMNSVPVIGAGTDFTINANGYIAQFITDVGDPNKLLIPAGNWNFETYFSASSGGGSPRFYIELYKYDGSTFTLIATSSATPENITGGTSIDLYFTALAVPSTSLLITDRLAVRFYVIHSGRTITMHTENSHLSQIITTFSSGLTALNGLTSQVQYLAVGTAGTDFNISSVTDTHTFNLPTASATNRGALSSADWSTFNGKFNLPSLTSGSVLFSNGTTIAQDNAQLFWDDTNNRLGIGTATPGATLDILSTSLNVLRLGRSGYDIFTFRSSIGSGLELFNTTDLRSEMFFNGSGNIGIGTTAPTAKLHIAAPGALSTDIALRVRNSADTADLLVTNGLGNVGIGTATPSQKLEVIGNAIFRSTSRIDMIPGQAATAGLLAGTAIGVNSNFTIFSSSGLAGESTDISYWNGGTYYPAFRISNVASGFSNLLLMKDGGNVGIGTTTPATKLEVGGSVFGELEALRLVNTANVAPNRGTSQTFYIPALTGSNEIGGKLLISRSSDNVGAYMSFSTTAVNAAGVTEKMRIQADGNVGIGTTAPLVKLGVAVNGTDSKFQGIQLTIPESTIGSARIGLVTEGISRQQAYIKFMKLNAGIARSGTIAFFTAGVDGDNGTEQMRITETGNVGIGTTAPLVKLHVVGTGESEVRVSENTNNNYITLYQQALTSYLIAGRTGATSVQPLAIYTGGSEKMRIQADGNIGINTTAPTAKLAIKAPGALSTDIALRVRNSADTTDLFQVQGNGAIVLSSGASFYTVGNNLNFRSNLLGGAGYVLDAQSFNSLNSTNNEQGFGMFSGTYAPTSGTGTLNGLKITPTINQTGGANGITRGLFINPTLTAAADFRAIETTVGNVILGSTSGNVGIGTTTPATKLDVNGVGTFMAFSTPTLLTKINGSYGQVITMARNGAGNNVGLGVAESGELSFYTNNAETIRIHSSGNLLIGTTTNIASSKLTIESTTQGFLPPRMTNAQRIAIATPAVGLCVYCTDVVEGLYINKSTGWTYIG